MDQPNPLGTLENVDIKVQKRQKNKIAARNFRRRRNAELESLRLHVSLLTSVNEALQQQNNRLQFEAQQAAANINKIIQVLQYLGVPLQILLRAYEEVQLSNIPFECVQQQQQQYPQRIVTQIEECKPSVKADTAKCSSSEQQNNETDEDFDRFLEEIFKETSINA
eukprot:TRINITY_DN22880_c0_g1_i11.p2 TRINITY_DN22880_c0_g1~~TRINITY_DN22880_c0_g1_i11.p2  ORF type:complete len:166 (-),score=20.90 TRINITY_DN22880_c0_g1_i11:327-824(-)